MSKVALLQRVRWHSPGPHVSGCKSRVRWQSPGSDVPGCQPRVRWHSPGLDVSGCQSMVRWYSLGSDCQGSSSGSDGTVQGHMCQGASPWSDGSLDGVCVSSRGSQPLEWCLPHFQWKLPDTESQRYLPGDSKSTQDHGADEQQAVMEPD